MSSDQNKKWGQWMESAQRGDKRAYDLLLKSIQQPIARTVGFKLKNAASRDDLVQDILLKIHKARHTYEPGRSFQAWMYAITKHSLIDHYRKQSVRPQGESEALENIESVRNAGANEKINLEQAWQQLDPAQQEIITWVKVEGKSIDETAQQLGVSPSALKVRVHRAYQYFKSLWQGE